MSGNDTKSKYSIDYQSNINNANQAKSQSRNLDVLE
jgi:hypothetical protein